MTEDRKDFESVKFAYPTARSLCTLILLLALPAPTLAETQSNVTSHGAIGQLAAHASSTAAGFVDEGVGVALSGGDALPLPRGDGALNRLAGHLPLRQLVTAGELAFNGQGFDALVVTGTEIADRVLRLADRPSSLRLQGATQRIRGVGHNGVFNGRGYSIGATTTYAVSADLVAGATIAMERSQILSNGRRDTLLSEGWTAAAELGWQASPDLTVSIAAGTSLIERDLLRDEGAITANPSAHRGFVALHADHSFERNGFRLNPSAAVNFTTEAQGDYVDSTGAAFDNRIVHYGRLTAEVEAGYRWGVARGALEVYSSVAGDWDFIRPGNVTLTRMRWNDDMPARAAVAGGVALTAPGGFRSGVEVRNSAIGPEGLNETRLQASLTLSF